MKKILIGFILMIGTTSLNAQIYTCFIEFVDSKTYPQKKIHYDAQSKMFAEVQIKGKLERDGFKIKWVSCS